MSGGERNEAYDVAIIGAGAAGLAAAIFTARRLPSARIVALEGAKKLGAKILVSGGGRCNVTNVCVGPRDFFGGSRNVVKRVLAALSADETVKFFRELGVGLHVEEHGKFFPDSNSAKSVLQALIRESARLGVTILTERRVTDIQHQGDLFQTGWSGGEVTAKCVVLATGGRSLPKTGSDGTGYELAQRLGHTLTPTTPGLVPLILDGDFHVPLSGVSHEVELTVAVEGEPPVAIRGALLWTHFGISGPAVLDASRHWERARLEAREVVLAVNFLPGEELGSVERKFLSMVADQPRMILRNALAALIPASVAAALLAALRIDARTVIAHLDRATRRRLIHAMLCWPLPVSGGRGYGFAEVTAGGVRLDEMDPATMESRKCPGLYLVGEVLDVDGRIGGFNFQWAWSSAFVAANGLASDRRLA
ncbi:MAG: NAD(P)/FAD-dependent oxidoreductase [Planctomycetota bacterium]